MTEPKNPYTSAVGVALAAWIFFISSCLGALSATHLDDGDLVGWFEGAFFLLGTLLGACLVGFELDKPRRPRHG
jgi:hypothetical protein